MSKVFRLNQVDVASASQYLGNLGAEIAVASTSTVTSTEGMEVKALAAHRLQPPRQLVMSIHTPPALGLCLAWWAQLMRV